jgi:hypothetical protein
LATFFQKRGDKMSDFVAILNAAGLTPLFVAVVVALGAITVYFAFIKKA